MRLNLLLDNPSGIRQGYINIDPFADIRIAICKRDNLKELGEVDDAEADEIVAMDVIDYFPLPEVNTMVHTWIRKLKHGANITIGFTEIYQLAKTIANRRCTEEEANRALHGATDKRWRLRCSTVSIDYIVKLLESYGLKIRYKRLHSSKAVVKATRL